MERVRGQAKELGGEGVMGGRVGTGAGRVR